MSILGPGVPVRCISFAYPRCGSGKVEIGQVYVIRAVKGFLGVPVLELEGVCCSKCNGCAEFQARHFRPLDDSLESLRKLAEAPTDPTPGKVRVREDA
jgi:hypothetical protein